MNSMSALGRKWSDLSDSHPIHSVLYSAYVDMLLDEPPNYDKFSSAQHGHWYEIGRQAMTNIIRHKGGLPKWRGKVIPDWLRTAYTIEYRGLRRNSP